jgi:hypothetical protein
MRIKITFLLLVLVLLSSGLDAQNAPVTTAGTVVSNATTIVVPVAVSDFNFIGSCNLRLLYNPAIVTATQVTVASGIPGQISFNVTTPGVISWGWFTYPGISLPDNTVVFNVSFSKAAPSGTSLLTWDDEAGYTCEWSNGVYVVMNDMPAENYYLNGSITIPDAPQTIAPQMEALANTSIDIPVTVIGFYNVGAISLTLHFNPLVLTFQSFVNNSGYPGLQVSNPSSGVITIGGFSATGGVTLADFAELVTIVFAYQGGYSDLIWFDNGPSCEYADFPEYNPYNDLPLSAFYFNGSVSELLFRNLDLKLLLEGLYNTANGNMNKTQDYVNDIFEDRFPGTVADQITIELYQAGNYSGGAVFSAPNTDLHQDGSAGISIPSSFNDEYYITVKTRNHIETVSYTSIDFGGSHVTYDFSTSAELAYGNNQVELEQGIYGFYAGDIDQNGVINVTDRTLLNMDLANVMVGYIVSDLDGNGTVNVTDRTKLNVNIFKVISKQTP